MRWNLLLAALAASWGIVSIIVAGVALPSEALVAWRCLFAVVALVGVLAVLRRAQELRVRVQRHRLLLLALALGFHWLLFFEALKRTSVAVAILSLYTAPIFVAILAPRMLPERQSRVALIALAVSAPGLVLIVLAGEGGSAANPAGIACGVGAAVLFALIIIGVKAVGDAMSPLVLGFWQYLIVGAAFFPLAFARGDALPEGIDWVYVALLGVVFTGISGPIHFWLLQRATAQTAGLLAYVEPVSASLLAWAILGQAVNWQVALGGAAVLVGGALVVVGEAAPTPSAAPAVAHGDPD
ncbi:MAG: DMT family transporter [Actinobacteria bacterium]|nr:DMT family transporter [Actinomycetota bacterium]